MKQRRLRRCGENNCIVFLGSTRLGYYRDVLLRQKLQPAIRRVSGNDFVFQHNSAPAYCARATVELLRQETPNFLVPNLWPPNNPDLSPVDYEIWAAMQRSVYQRHFHSVNELQRELIDVWCGTEQSKFLSRLWQGKH